MQILITYGSKLGGSAGIAHMLADRLSAAGIETQTAPASLMVSPDPFDAVIVGGALYANRWHRSARRYVRRFARALRTKPVWMFSSGPLDDSALAGIPPTAQVQQTMESVGARDHITFGGRLEPDAKGFLAGSMAKEQAGDWRDPDQIHDWADMIADAMHREPVG